MGAILREWFGIALGALATLGASGIAVWAGRRDRAQDKLEAVKGDLAETKEDVAHIEGHLEVKTGYRPRNK